MRAGELRHRIVLYANTPTRDSFNQEIEHWNVVATLWANVTAVSGDETIAQKEEIASLAYSVKIRAYPAISPTMQIIWTHHAVARTLQIHSIVEEENGSMMLLACSEVVG